MRCLLNRGKIPRHGRNGASPLNSVFDDMGGITVRRGVTATLTLLCALTGPWASGHPSSAIVVDRNGRVYFTDNGGEGALWSIETGGDLTVVQKGRLQGFHWLALDERGLHSQQVLAKWHIGRVALSGTQWTLLKTDGYPLVVDPHGTLYFAKGNREMARLSPDGTVTLLGPSSGDVSEKLGGWITGLAAATDGSIYIACSSAVLKVTPQGTVTTLVDPAALQRLSTDPAGTESDDKKPSLRGLAADSRGTVYAADTGRRGVVKITPDGKIETLLKTGRPWTPTGVTVHGQDIYVLEYANADEDYPEWLPRVRRLGIDGIITTLSPVSRGHR